MNNTHTKTPHLARIDLNLFRVFAAIYQEKNLTRAAEMLFISQSAMSHALARLRENLNDPLFVRDGYGVSPTPLANRLWPDIEKSLNLLQTTLQRVHHFDAKQDLKQLNLAMNDEIEPVLLPPIAVLFRKLIPELHINSIRIDRKTLKQDLATGKIDFAIDIAHLTESGIAHELLLQDQFVVMRKVQTTASRTLTAKQYQHAQHIAVSARPTGRTVEDLQFAKKGIERHIALRCQQYESAVRIISQSDLLLTIPQTLASYLKTHFLVEILVLPIALAGLEMHLYWDQNRSNETQIVWCRTQLFQLFRPIAQIDQTV